MKTPEASNLPTPGRRTLSFDAEPSRQSTFNSRVRSRPHISSSLLCHLSFQPHCTALFCAVPRNRFFSLFGISPSSSFVPPSAIRDFSFAFPTSPSRCVATSLPARMLTFPPQVPDLTLFNPFYLRPIRSRSTSFHQKRPQFHSFHLIPPTLYRQTEGQLSPFPLHAQCAFFPG